MAYPLDFEAEKSTFCLGKILANITRRLKPLVTGYAILGIINNFFMLSKSKLENILMFLYVISYCH